MASIPGTSATNSAYSFSTDPAYGTLSNTYTSTFVSGNHTITNTGGIFGSTTGTLDVLKSPVSAVPEPAPEAEIAEITVLAFALNRRRRTVSRG